MSHNFILFDYITDKLKINLVRFSEYVEPINLNTEQAAVLNTVEGLASFLLWKVYFDKDNRPIILSRIIIRGDKCRLHSEK
jgi:DNA-binding GntR family transcriptional regulator